MGFNFPNAPTVGQLYPVPAIAGAPVYKWDGEKWTTQGAPLNKTPVYTDGSTPMTAQLTLITPPVAPTDAVAKSYVDGGAGGTLVRTDVAQGLTAAQQAQGRQNIYAAPFDAMAFNGLQINGSMEVSQWLAGNTNNGISAGISNMLDGFKINAGGPVVMTGQVVGDAPPGYSNSLKVSVTTADAALAAGSIATIYHYIEGYRVERLGFGTANAQPLSIGFWVKAHRPGQYGGVVLNSAANRSCPFSYTINAADTWEFKAVTVTGDVTGAWLGGTSLGLILGFSLAAGATYTGPAGVWAAANLATATGCVNGIAATTDTFQITGIIALPGIELPSAARAPFIMRPFDQELVLCQRYYEKSYDQFTPPGTATGVGYNSCIMMQVNYTVGGTYTLQKEQPFLTRKRAAATVTTYSPQTGATGKARDGASGADVNCTLQAQGDRAFVWAATMSATASTALFQLQYVADARF